MVVIQVSNSELFTAVGLFMGSVYTFIVFSFLKTEIPILNLLCIMLFFTSIPTFFGYSLDNIIVTSNPESESD